MPSDLFPGVAVASVVGIGGTVGAIGGMMTAKFVGYILDTMGSYAPIFAVAGLACLLASLSLHVIGPRLAPVDV